MTQPQEAKARELPDGCPLCGSLPIDWVSGAEDRIRAVEELVVALGRAVEEFDLIQMRLRDDQPERGLGAAFCGHRDALAALTRFREAQ